MGGLQNLEACQGIRGKIFVLLIKSNNSAVLSIKDNGPGIPEEIQKKIFNPYFTTREEGTGLGLSIVHQIVEEFGGELKLKSLSDNGTEFEIKFPLN